MQPMNNFKKEGCRSERVSESFLHNISSKKWGKASLLTGVVSCLVPFFVDAADLKADEQGPTAPEAIATVTANEDFLLPSYVAPSEASSTSSQTAETAASSLTAIPSEVDILNEIFGSSDPVQTANKQIAAVAAAAPARTQTTFCPQTGVQKKEALLTPLPPLPVIPSEVVIDPPKSTFKQSGYADQALATAASPSSGIGMPREIRLTFYPGQAAYSAQALKWVKAFGVHVVNDPRLFAEIRVSEQNWNLQKKRLNILLQILKEVGVTSHQIRLYKTGRDENSILMGYVYNPEYTLMGNGKKSENGGQKTIDW